MTGSASSILPLPAEARLELYYFMRLARETDNAILRLYKQGKMVGGAYTGNGNEATAVGSAYALEKRDCLLPMHRDLGSLLVKGQSLRAIFLQQLGRADSLTGGIGGEIAALIAEHAFRSLDAPVRRLAALDTPVPFAPPLEEYVLPNTRMIAAAMRELAQF